MYFQFSLNTVKLYIYIYIYIYPKLYKHKINQDSIAGTSNYKCNIISMHVVFHIQYCYLYNGETLLMNHMIFKNVCDI